MTNNKIIHPRINALKKNAKKSTNTKHPKSKGGKKTRRRRTKRRLRKSSKVNRRRRRKTRKTKRRRRRRRQRGGGAGCGCQNPFVGKAASALGNGHYSPSEPVGRLPYSMLTRQPQAVNMRGGGLWQDLGLTLPKELYNDGLSNLYNLKNTWVGDTHETTSNVLKQPIANSKSPTMHPIDYFDEFRKADASIANELNFDN